MNTAKKIMMMVFLFLLICFRAVSGSFEIGSNLRPKRSSGLTYRLYENAGLAGVPARFEGITPAARMSLEPPPNSNITSLLLSGELLGTLWHRETNRTSSSTGDAIGEWIVFRCIFRNTSNGWVKIDGHLVCHDGNAFTQMIDNDPILFKRRRGYSFRGRIMTNETTPGGVRPSLEVYWMKYDPKLHAQRPNEDYFSIYQEFRLLSVSDNDNDGLKLQPSLSNPEQERETLQRNLQTGWGYWLRQNILSLVKLPEGIVITFQICARSKTDSSYNECLSSIVPDSKGIVRVDRHAYDRSYTSFHIHWEPSPNPITNATAALDVRVEMSVTGKDHQELRYVITCQNCDAQRHDEDRYFVVHRRGTYGWFLPGIVAPSKTGILFETPGLGNETVTTSVRTNTDRFVNQQAVSSRKLKEGLSTKRTTYGHIPGETLPLGTLITVTAGLGGAIEDMDTTTAFIENRKHKEDHRILERFGGDQSAAETATAIQAAVMWSLIYNPMEEGAFLPVSRSESWASFGERAGAVTSDWTYVIFEWDNLFASLLAGLESKEIAYSNLFQVVKSKTAQGFLPNWSTAGGIAKSKDRTEPPVGAKVLLQLYNKYKDMWLVEGLFDDLVYWNDWFWKNRRVSPLGLIGLGSYYKPQRHPFAENYRGDSNNMQSARYESGLDNSPMYDGDDLFNNETHKMRLYDVGMSSLVAHEAYCLAELADILGKEPKVGLGLRRRGDELKSRITEFLWDPKRQIFANRYQNNSFVDHVTPTSFYPLLLFGSNHSTPHNISIDNMVKGWLLNPDRFCLSSQGDFAGNDPHRCYWGLPSVSADDSTFMATGQWNYWRGLIWGPMSQIVYWGLQQVSSPAGIIEEARSSLCHQMKAMMMNQWRKNRHICENYSPYRDEPDCSGTLFYHWGALNGLIGMLEAGMY